MFHGEIVTRGRFDDPPCLFLIHISLCTVTIDRLEIVQAIEPGLQSVVLSVSMKVSRHCLLIHAVRPVAFSIQTPHRSLRSNELPVPASGTLAIPLKLLFSLQVW